MLFRSVSQSRYLDRDKRRVVGKNSSKDLRFFKAILGEELHDEIMSMENKKVSPEDLYNAYKDRIESAVKQFVSREAEDTYDLLREFGIIEHTAEGIVVENLRFAEDVDLTEENIKTDFPDLTGWLNQNNNSGKKAGSNTVDALSGADHKAKSGKVPNLNPMNKYINGGK